MRYLCPIPEYLWMHDKSTHKHAHKHTRAHILLFMMTAAYFMWGRRAFLYSARTHRKLVFVNNREREDLSFSLI